MLIVAGYRVLTELCPVGRVDFSVLGLVTIGLGSATGCSLTGVTDNVGFDTDEIGFLEAELLGEPIADIGLSEVSSFATGACITIGAWLTTVTCFTGVAESSWTIGGGAFFGMSCELAFGTSCEAVLELSFEAVLELSCEAVLSLSREPTADPVFSCFKLFCGSDFGTSRTDCFLVAVFLRTKRTGASLV